MDELRLSMEEADAMVLSILKENIDCSENIRIHTAINDGKFSYELEDQMLYHCENFLRKTPLKYMEYITLLKTALAKKGYDRIFIKPVIRKREVKYIGTFRLIEVTRSRRKK